MPEGEEELRVVKAAALEWREKWRKAEFRMEVVWNRAVDECMERLGNAHSPEHYAECYVCWSHKKLAGLRKLDIAGYVPVKERLRKKLSEFRMNTPLSDKERTAYNDGLDDMMGVIDDMLGEKE